MSQHFLDPGDLVVTPFAAAAHQTEKASVVLVRAGGVHQATATIAVRLSPTDRLEFLCGAHDENGTKTSERTFASSRELARKLSVDLAIELLTERTEPHDGDNETSTVYGTAQNQDAAEPERLSRTLERRTA